MKKMHYIGYCFAAEEKNEYLCNVASNLKMHYVAGAAKQAGYDVTMVSLCKTSSGGFRRASVNQSEDISIYHIASTGKGAFLHKLFNLIIFYAQIIVYFLFNVKKDDHVILYHSVRPTHIISKLLKFKNADNVILEVEEIYANAADGVKDYLDKEIKDIKKYRNYIFVNDFIPATYEIPKDRYIVVYGSYDHKNMSVEKFDSNKIHVLYAGAIEKLNGGAFTAIETARHLPANYVMHILGKGNDADVSDAVEKIKNINEECGCEKIVYSGFLSGEALDVYMSKCDIGVATYKIMDKYSNFVFPSKLVSYMCHNLKIVTGRSECYENAAISKEWYFYDDNDFISIADAIVCAASDNGKADSSQIIKKLNEELIYDLNGFLNGRLIGERKMDES